MYIIYDYDKISCVMKSKNKYIPNIYIEKFIKKDKIIKKDNKKEMGVVDMVINRF
jgi:hypothetical protein